MVSTNASLSDIGLIGLAVMGQNLALNIADHGFQISVYNRTVSKTQLFIDQNPEVHQKLVACVDLKALIASLRKPRKVIILVQAGAATAAVIHELSLLMEVGDIIIDAGNAYWLDTITRQKQLEALGIHFVGSGISGGEEGARFGPSLMAGGSPEAWEAIEPIWKAVAAKVDGATGKVLAGGAPGKPIQGGEPCAAYIGTDGAGHYVKMVHNGIEYGDMQLICEAYDLLKNLLNLTPEQMSAIFARWNTGLLESYLIEITSTVLSQIDPITHTPFIDCVQDRAGQKGTGKWTAINGIDMGITTPTIAEAVFARCMSAIKEEREHAATLLSGPKVKYTGSAQELIDAIEDALYCSKICSYAQGFQLMRQAQSTYNWHLNFGQIAQIWRGGCIIRAAFLQKITDAYTKNPALPNLLLDPYFTQTLQSRQDHWRTVVALGCKHGISLPCFSSALAYFDGYRQERLPHNLLQGLRDHFGAHTYERVDAPKGTFFHLEWSTDKSQTHI